MRGESFHLWHWFPSFAAALLFAEIMERMTGEFCEVESFGYNRHRVLRHTTDGKVILI